jgi:ABC-type branched-subunit amino acid transport system permease subunit
MGIMAVFSLSYNMLLGQTGLLSFGHAVYYGLGAFATMHALNAIGKGGSPLVTAVLPARRRPAPASRRASCWAMSRRARPAPPSP